MWSAKLRVYVVQKDYIFYRIVVALRMECVDLSIGDIMEMVRRTPYGVRGFKYICVCQFGLVNCTGTYDTSPIWNA